MRIVSILEAIGDEDDLIEQLIFDDALKVTEIYNIMKFSSNNFTLSPDKTTQQSLAMIGMKMFIYRDGAIKALGEDSNTVHKIKIVLAYIRKLK